MTSRDIRRTLICFVLINSVPLILSLICDPDEYYCENTHKCIDSEYICDGDNDCGDNSDEEAALCSRNVLDVITFLPVTESSSVCWPHQIECSEGSGAKCILRSWVCDGEWDCLHGSDEELCAAPTTNPTTTAQPVTRPTLRAHLSTILSSQSRECRGSEFRCHGRCLMNKYVCDGEKDCYDGSDENPEICLVKTDSTYRITSTVQSDSPVPSTDTTRIEHSTNRDINSYGAVISSDEKPTEDCNSHSSSPISFSLLNWIECILLILGIICVIAIAAFICKKRKRRSVGLDSRNAEDRRQAVSFLNSSVAPECQLVLVGTPVQVQPVQSTIEQPPPYDTQASLIPSRVQNSTKGEEF